MEVNSSRIGATGSAKNAPVLVYGLSIGAVLEDEEGNEDNDAVSDASSEEEGSEGSEVNTVIMGMPIMTILTSPIHFLQAGVKLELMHFQRVHRSILAFQTLLLLLVVDI